MAAGLVVLILLTILSGVLISGTSPSNRAPGNAGLRTDVIAATQLYLNRSVHSAVGTSAFTYPKEFVTLNNSTTLTGIPVLLTVKSATDCRWVTVQLPSNVSTGATTFTTNIYQNVTGANNSGAVVAAQTVLSFKACGGSAYFVNWLNQGYGIFDFNSNVGVNATATVVFTQPAGAVRSWTNTTLKWQSGKTLVVKVAAGAIWRIAFNSTVSGPTSCTAFSGNQICSYQLWTFTSLAFTGTGAANTSTNPVLTFQSAATVQGTWSNWSLSYASSNVTLNTPTGAFLVLGGGFLTMVFVNFWWAWLLLLIVVTIVYATWHRGGRRMHYRRE